MVISLGCIIKSTGVVNSTHRALLRVVGAVAGLEGLLGDAHFCFVSFCFLFIDIGELTKIRNGGVEGGGRKRVLNTDVRWGRGAASNQFDVIGFFVAGFIWTVRNRNHSYSLAELLLSRLGNPCIVHRPDVSMYS